MGEILKILTIFGEEYLSIDSLCKIDSDEILRSFIKKQKKKIGVYIFINSAETFPKNIIYVGKAGEVGKERSNDISSRLFQYFNKSPNYIFSNSGFVKFKKFNSKKVNPSKIKIKSGEFEIITVSILKSSLLSPALIEAYILNYLLKDKNYYPIANSEI